MKHLQNVNATIPSNLSALTLAIATLILTGCASGGSESKFATTNPFAIAGASSATEVQVNTLRVFGDSYSDPAYSSPRGIVNWTDTFKASSKAANLENYAIGGARTQFTQTISFDKQLDNWRDTNSSVTDRDLTVSYFGHNDIGRFGVSGASMGASKAGYADGLNQLVQAGAASGTNRVFIAQIHDWSRNPGVDTGATRNQVIEWNNYVAELANTNPNVIAVDLYTVINRVLDDPAKYGFSNVATADNSRHAIDALFYDTIHLGTRGQDIIARTFQHYLTRAWNWANAIEAGSAAAAQLNQDIDQGLLVLSMQEKRQDTAKSRISLVPLGMQDGAWRDRSVLQHSFNHYAPGTQSPAFSGVALNFSSSDTPWGGTSHMGLALNQKTGSTQIGSAEGQTRMGMQSHAATAYWVQPLSKFLLTTQVSQTSQLFSQSAADDLVMRSVNNSRKGSNWSFESKLRYAINGPSLIVTPWASLTQTRQRLDAGTLQTLYTSDVAFSSSQSKEWISGLGVDLQFAPIRLAGGKQLLWGGSLMHRESISRDSFVVSMRESAQPQIVQREMVDRARVNQTYLGFNAQLDLNKHWNVSASYSTDIKRSRDTQAVKVRANVLF